jgi:hypothetical protein
MFSGGEKKSFFCFVIGNSTMATLAEKKSNFTYFYKGLRYQSLKVLYFPPECEFACPVETDK